MLSMVGTPDSRDLVICLISGGASAMMPLPAKGLTLPEKRAITQMLSASGAGVGEVNTVRRHLSQIKGGRLAELLFPATVLSLIISDVVDNKLEDIGSGPTAPDPSTYADALRVLQKYSLWQRTPSTAKRIIQNGIEDSSKETPKPGSRVFRRVLNVIVGDNRLACSGAAKSLHRNGYRTIVLTQKLQGEAREAGRLFAAVISGIGHGQFSLPRPVALVAGGETTVVVRGSGRGGRNQELVLSAAIGIDGMRNVVVLSGGTDGLDGATEAAGAFADGSTLKRALARGLVAQTYLDNNDSYSFFRKVKGQIVTGPTGTNVSDITIMAAGVSR
jgi:glycerate 2-kinase